MKDIYRLGYKLRYFFDADVDERGHIDIEGYDVYNNDILIAELEFVSKEDINKMTDDELNDLIEDNLIK